MNNSEKLLYDIIDPNPSWREMASCKNQDVNLFMSFEKDEITKAKSICIGCPVVARCLEYALVNGVKDGVWGGTTPSERRKIKINLKSIIS